MKIPLLQTAETWLASESPVVRRHALRRLEQAANCLPRERTLALLERFDCSRDAWSAALARRLRRRLRSQGSTLEISASMPGTLDSLDQWRAPGMLPFPTVALRQVALGLLRPIAQTAARRFTGLSRGSPASEFAWEAVAPLGHPEFTREAGRLCREGLATPGVLRALACGQEPGTGQLLVEVLEGPITSLHPFALALMPLIEGFDPRRALQQAGRSRLDSVRAAVALAWGEVEGPAAIQALVALVRDSSPYVALTALQALGPRRDDRVPGLLRELTVAAGEPGLRAEALRLLALYDEAAPISVLEGLPVSAVELPVAVAALETLPLLGLETSRLRHLLEPLLDHRSPRLRAAAQVASMAWRPAEACATLAEMLGDGSPEARRWAGYSVSQVPETILVQRAVGSLLAEEHPAAQAGLMEGLRGAAPGCPLELLLPLLEGGRPVLRLWAVELAAELPESSWTAHLSRRQGAEPDRAVRDGLVLASARRHSLAELRQCLGPSRPDLAVVALERLEAYSALEVVGLVTPLLEAPAPAVRARAAVALWRFGSLAGLPTLEALLAEPSNPACHSAGLEALGRLGHSLESGALERLPGLIRTLSQEKATPGHAELDDDTSGLPSLPKVTVEQPGAQPGSGSASKAKEVSRGPARSETAAGSGPANDVRIERLLRLGLCDAAAAHQAIRTMDPVLRSTAEGTYLRLREMLATESEEALPLAEEYVALPSGPLVAPYLELGLVFASRWDEARTLRCYLNAFKTQVAVLSALLEQVQDHLGRDEFSHAQASLELLTKLMPLDESVHRSAGRTFLRGRRLEPAVSQLFLAHLLDPSDLKVTVELAVCCIQTGRGDLARELAESVLATVPADSLWAQKASKVLSSLERKR